MVRLIGILTGSALAVAFLILTLGVPELAKPGEREPGDDVPTIAQARSASTWTVSPETSEPGLAERAEPPAVAPAAAEPEPEPEPTRTEPDVPDEPPAAADATGPAGPEQASGPSRLDRNWYAFWSPFRSRLAAEGFVAELQRTTGLDYRVVKLKPGIYEVAFAYEDDTDIQDKLTLISAATGLDMSGG